MTDEVNRRVVADHQTHQPDPATPRRGRRSPTGIQRNDFEQLRRLLTAQEQEQLRQLEQRVDSLELEVSADSVSEVLPEAIELRATTDGRLTDALAPSVEAAIASSVQRNPDAVAQAIYPTLGPVIRKAIADALSAFVETVNLTIDHNFSLHGLRWRFESLRTGVPYAHIVIRDSLVYQVEQVFLIHADTGLLLAHAAAEGVRGTDPDLVSGMLTAIRDFVADSFDAAEDGGLRRFTVGEREVVAEAGPQMVIAAVVHGPPGATLRERLQTTLETLHARYRRPIEEFAGDNAAFAGAMPLLQECFDTVLRPVQKGWGARVVVGVVVCAIIAAPVVFAYRTRARWSRALDLLRAEPGLVLLEAQRGWRRSTIDGLRDPLAAQPAELLAGSGFDATRLEQRWRPYLSLEPGMTTRRANQLLRPSDAITLTLEDGTLRVSGTASPAWLAHAAATAVPGVMAVDLSAVQLRRSSTLEQTVTRLERQRVLFSAGSASLASSSARERLAAIVESYRQLGRVATAEGWRADVSISGRTDASGSAEQNSRLSLERAIAVRDALRELGMSTDGIRVTGLGGSDRLLADDAEQQSALNRSASLTIVLTSHEGSAP